MKALRCACTSIEETQREREREGESTRPVCWVGR